MDLALKPVVTCTKPGIRREWRALSIEDRSEFFQAVNCLGTVRSSWRPNGTLYDDFAYLHGTIGSLSRHPNLHQKKVTTFANTSSPRPSLRVFFALAQIHTTCLGNKT
jgi:hypothetical protein